MCTPAAPAFRHGLSMSTLRWLVSLQPRQSNSISLRNRNINRSSIRNTISGGAVNFNSSGVARAAAPGPCIQPNFGAYAGLLGRRGYATASSPCHDGALREAFDSNVLDSNLHARSPPTTSANHGLLLRKEFQSMASFAQLVDDVRIAGDDIVRRISELPPGDVQALQLMDDLSDLICRAVDPCECLRQIHPEAMIRASATEACIGIVTYMEGLNTNVNLHQAMHSIVHHESFAGLDEESRRTAENLLHDFEQSGIFLPDELRDRVVRLNETLQAKRMEFEEGVADFGYTPISLQKADVVPGSWLLGHFEGKDTIKVNMGNPESSKQLMMHVGSPSLRQKIFSAAYAVEPRHTHTFDELMKNRLDLAKLVGYPSWGHKVLEHGMVQEPEMVADFLKHLRVRLQPHLKEEVATMKAMQMQMDDAMATQLENTTTKTTTATEKDLLPSDRHFLVGLAQESTRPPDLPEYFSVGNCMEGLGMITEHIYGVKLVVTASEPGEVWHPEVIKLVAHHATEGVLGTIYCDLFARPDKNLGAAQYTLQTGRQVVPPPPAESSYQNPIVALVCGFQPSADTEPALLSMSEVETLFHEAGHALHSMFGRTRFQTVAGTRCSLDFVELPSMLMEFFVRDYRVVSRFARHYETGAPLSKELFERGIQAQDLFPAVGMADSAIHAEADQRYHSATLSPGAEEATAVLRGVQDEYTELKFCGTALQYRFSHLSGYAASYYSYLWCKGLAALIWTTSFVDDPLSRTAGDRYRKSVLAYGSARDPWLMVEEVLGYKPTPEDVVDGLIRATFARPVDPDTPTMPPPNKY